jgi:ABC-type glycerol-3-phosphate transport system substrate-binding protein
LDTPALFTNIDLLKSASITEPPTTWREMQDEVVKLTQKDATTGALRQSGIALGLATNVMHSTDIVVSLMLQNGAQMVNDSTRRASFHEYTPATQDNVYPPGVEALMFYEGFADPNAVNYTWNAEQPTSLDAFITGKTAFFVGFPADVATVRERAPRLNFDIAPLPLIDESRKITVAHYPVEVVSAKTKHANEAWDFLLFMTQPEQASPYLTAAKRPTALRALIAEQLTNADLKAFAGQVLTARSWYHGLDYNKVEDIFDAMILRKPTERLPTYEPIVSDAANEVDRIR